MLLRNGGLIIIIAASLNSEILAQSLKSYEAIAKDILKYGEESKPVPEGYPRFYYVKDKLINLYVSLQVYPDRLPEGKCDGLIKISAAIQALLANFSLLLLIPVLPTLGRILEPSVREFIAQKLRELNDFLFDIVSKLIAYGIPFLLKSAIIGILKALQNIAKPIFDILKPILEPLLGPVEPYLKPIFEFLTNFIRDVLTGIYDALGTVVSWIIYAVIKLLKGIWDILSTLLYWIKKPFEFIIDPVLGFISTAFNNFGFWIFKFLSSVGDGANVLRQVAESTIFGPLKKMLNM